MLKRLTIRAAPLLVAFSLFSCGKDAPKPHILACIVNAPAKHRICYQLDKDYNDDGTIKAGAVPVIRANETLADLNKSFTIDSVNAETPPSAGFVDALALFKAYLKEMKNRFAHCVSGN
jgi:hypothetical protein